MDLARTLKYIRGEGTNPVVDAVIYVRPENYSASAARCLDYCSARRYNVVGLIPGDWAAAMRMCRSARPAGWGEPDPVGKPIQQGKPDRAGHAGANRSRGASPIL